MVLQSSGAISLNDIQTEFGGTNPISINEYYDAATGVPASGVISFYDFYGKSAIVPGQQWYISSGTYTFTVPSNVTFVSAVVVGGGGGSSGAQRYTSGWSTRGYGGYGGGGGGLAYGTFTVTPGDTITVVVGAGGTGGNGSSSSSTPGYGGSGGESYIYHNGNYMIRGYGGVGGRSGGTGGSYYINTTYVTNSGGYSGGTGAVGLTTSRGGGGAGAGGYSGSGGNGHLGLSSGGGGNGGENCDVTTEGGGGGGVGLLGSGVGNDGAGVNVYDGDGGSGGGGGVKGIGGTFGGGGGGCGWSSNPGFAGGSGGVRIVWGEEGRKYPLSTNVPNIYSVDILLTSSYQSQLSTWGYTPDSLVYKSSVHGFTNSAFHIICDGLSQSIVVITTENGYIFGGIAVNSWDGLGGYKSSPNTNPFVFNLSGNSSAPIKWNITNTSYNIYANPNYGPTFGGGHDIYTTLDTNNMYESDHSYGSGGGYTGRVTGYTSSGINRIVDIEVWSIT